MFNYKFPYINTINDLFPIVLNNPYFTILEKEDYNVIVNNCSGNDVFPPVVDKETALLRECRGIIFDKDGNILSRPYHKFMNINESEEYNIKHIDFSQSHTILEKLDGSMIRPIKIGKQFRLATKRGITDISLQAENFINDKENYSKFINYCMECDYSVIFEWCSRKNRIVLDYPEDRLVLTAIRNNYNGIYMSYADMLILSEKYSIDCVKAFDNQYNNIEEFIRYTKGLQDQEGFVVRFVSGHMFKIKADDYVKIHKALNNFSSEKNVIRLILEDKLDDIKPLLDEKRREYINNFEGNFENNLYLKYRNILDVFEEMKRLYPIKKDFAIHIKRYFPNLSSILFAAYDGKHIMDFMIKFILKHTNSNTNLQRVKFLYGNLEWKIDDFMNGEDND